MNTILPSASTPPAKPLVKGVVAVILVALLFTASLGLLLTSQSPAGQSTLGRLSSLLGMGSVQSWWYVTRAAGLTSYLLMWLSMVWGLVVSSRMFHPVVEAMYAYDFHEFLSLLGIGFVILHVGVLMLDKYLPFSILQILIPFVDTYRPLWVGLGIIGFYILLLVTVTFYLRKSIGIRAFRSIHVLSFLGYLGATFHGLFAGTDSALPVARGLYVSTALIVVFLTGYWITLTALAKRETVAVKVEAPTRARGRRGRSHRG